MSQDDARQRLLNTAGPIFAEKGFEKATVRDICQAAGVNLAAVNYYFGDKEQLYIETVKQAHRRKLEQVPYVDRPPGTEPATLLRDFVHTLVGRMLVHEDDPWESQLMMREIIQPTGACRELVEDFFRPQFRQMLEVLRQLAGPDVPPTRLEQLIFSIVGQCLYYRISGSVVGMLVDPDDLARYYQPEQLADHVADVVLAALGTIPPLGQAGRAPPPQCAKASAANTPSQLRGQAD